MKCSYCGKNNKEGALFCKRCGIGLPPPPPPAASTAIADPIPGAERPAAPSAVNAKAVKKAKRKKQFTMVLVMLALVAAAALAIVIAASSRGEILRSGNGYTALDGALFYRGQSAFAEDEKLLSVRTDNDASTAGALTKEGLLYCFTSGRQELTARYVTDFTISDDGKFFVYRDENGLLWSSDRAEPENAPVCICNDLVNTYVVSPDGKAVIFSKQNDDSLYLYSDRKLTVIAEKLSPVAVSNGAKHIWAYSHSENALYHCDKRGSKTCIRSGLIGNLYFNSTHEEAAFSIRSGENIVITMVSFGGAEPVEVLNTTGPLRPVQIVSGIELSTFGLLEDGVVITCPFKSFDKRVFKGEELVSFTKSGSKVLDPNKCLSAFVTDDYSTLIYVSNNTLLRRKLGEDAESETIASDAADFMCSTNGSRIWYLGTEGVLYSMRGTSVTPIAPEVNVFTITPNGNDALYIKGGILCRSSGGNANSNYFFGSLHASQLASDNNGLYALTENGWQKFSSGGEKVTW